MDHGDAALPEHDPIKLNRTMLAEVIVRSHYSCGGQVIRLALPENALKARENARLRELIRTNDLVLVSAVGALLDGAGIFHLVLDQNMSVVEGSLGVLPRRILVNDGDSRAARRLLAEAGLAHELRPDDADDRRAI